MCVQRFDDSLGSAIRITYRISLRSSSLREPRHPLLKVVCCIGKNAYSCSHEAGAAVQGVFRLPTRGEVTRGCKLVLSREGRVRPPPNSTVTVHGGVSILDRVW